MHDKLTGDLGNVSEGARSPVVGWFVVRRENYHRAIWAFATISTMNGFMQCSKKQPYSITSSAVASSVGGTVRPNALAVFRLMTNSNLVGCTTGRSPGLSPLRIRPSLPNQLLPVRPAARWRCYSIKCEAQREFDARDGIDAITKSIEFGPDAHGSPMLLRCATFLEKIE